MKFVEKFLSIKNVYWRTNSESLKRLKYAENFKI